MMHRAGILVGIVAALAGGGGETTRPPMPKITRPVLFGTPEADRILAALQVFPPDNPWNRGHLRPPGAREFGADYRIHRGR